ncbi:hypothetical protein [Mycolicibacterium goodii]|uniref:SnoaL-like domain-containing protein n=1 Tax=Mycolicibacterium goodii TaxID=134601 RepID=A0A0K0X2G3_MYCGD|nr:hypothetical protein AFA91_06675 [Mycolicibacterium goodii]
MSVTASSTTTGEVARHHVANLLYAYVDIADRKDITAAVGLLGHARVRFPGNGFETIDDAQPFFAGLWAPPGAHRHDVSNLRVEPGEEPFWHAFAHYTRWLFTPEPLLHTLGEYALTVDARTWSITALTVTRTWTRAESG